MIDSVLKLIQFLVSTYGANLVLAAALGLFVVMYGFRFYETRGKDRTTERAFSEMEKAVQRSAAEAREYKIAFFKEKLGWSDAEIDAYIVKNLPTDGPSARRALESEGGKQ
jgi:hypothetical protein